ncbi:MAG: hypothetical protein MRY79_02905 [Alphaproteobacteria bacterium]|nr:hypothetical protein [Alphaproteobacteria bacterium]
MDVDLFLTPRGECGMLCSEGFAELPAGAIFDAETMEITVEFPGDAPFHMNITVEDQLRDRVLLARKLYMGFLENGLIADTLEVPLLYLNDPYGTEFGGMSARPQRSMVKFEMFMRECNAAQPLHREDLGDENASGSVLKGMDPKHLEFVPQLIRQRMLEVGGPEMQAGPATPVISAPHPKGPGLGGGAGTSRRQIQPRRRPPEDDGDDQG